MSCRVITAAFIVAVLCCCCVGRQPSIDALVKRLQATSRVAAQPRDAPAIHCTDRYAIEVYFLLQPRETPYNGLHAFWKTIQEMNFFELFSAGILDIPYENIRLSVGLINGADAKTCTTQVTPLTDDAEEPIADFNALNISEPLDGPINTWGAIYQLASSLKTLDKSQLAPSDPTPFRIIIAMTAGSADAFGSPSDPRECNNTPYPTAEAVSTLFKEKDLHLGLIVNPFEMAHWKDQVDQTGLDAELRLYTIVPDSLIPGHSERSDLLERAAVVYRWATELPRSVDFAACKSIPI